VRAPSGKSDAIELESKCRSCASDNVPRPTLLLERKQQLRSLHRTAATVADRSHVESANARSGHALWMRMKRGQVRQHLRSSYSACVVVSSFVRTGPRVILFGTYKQSEILGPALCTGM